MKTTISLLTISAAMLFMVIASHGAEITSAIPLPEAVDIAIRHVPGEVIKAEREGGLYEIKVRTAEGKTQTVFVDTVSGEIIEKRIIPLEEAVAAALKEVPGDVVKVEFERGKYEIKVRSSDGTVQEIYIDAENGKTIKIKRD